ncbi:hypothetical protein CDL15_Pgr024751 [Punica granatum]|uniref:Uncharacterized protein n=1 Tax=Punica granatum TaxID=22663 RepID=A0A218W4V5_PUNGR|nr:hypothetical protein CDL15_Pgr024751 [Punica granatum]
MGSRSDPHERHSQLQNEAQSNLSVVQNLKLDRILGFDRILGEEGIGGNLGGRNVFQLQGRRTVRNNAVYGGPGHYSPDERAAPCLPLRRLPEQQRHRHQRQRPQGQVLASLSASPSPAVSVRLPALSCAAAAPVSCEGSASSSPCPSSQDSRRCALEKAEQLKQQRKKEVGPKRESGREVNAQADDLAYVMLSHPVHKNLLEAPTEVSKEKGTRVDRFMHELLQKGDSAKKYMQSFRSKKFNDVILLDNYVKRRSGFVGSRLRALQTHSKRSKVHMSMKEHKKCGTFDLSQDLCQFHHFVPMHEMWKSYMIELFKSRKGDPLDKSLLTADLHGAIIHVADCKVTSFIGANGIMIRETAATFGLITRDNKFRVVPKRDSVFIFQADCWKVTLFGEKLIGRDSGL